MFYLLISQLQAYSVKHRLDNIYRVDREDKYRGKGIIDRGALIEETGGRINNYDLGLGFYAYNLGCATLHFKISQHTPSYELWH